MKKQNRIKTNLSNIPPESVNINLLAIPY